ncbi:HTH domain-containing protein [Halomarina halobia]|uniref:HTH domain-containing protein n=1 Tax=Halomarina halobia TaxID=3033386 RepID=A0ABD6A7J7_9EURY|nr:HTH domain-containing protein [Halomarina sp. PSR21]
MSDADSHRTVELFVRSLTSSERQAGLSAAIDRLSRLESEGHIDGFAVRVWGDGVCLSGPAAETETAAEIRERVEEFAEWAEASGVELPGFERRETRSMVTDRCHENLTLPVMALADRTDDDLTFVAPCVDGGTVRTVGDRLATLAGEDAKRARGRSGASIQADD